MTEEASAEVGEKLPTCQSVEIQAVEESATAIQIVILRRAPFARRRTWASRAKRRVPNNRESWLVSLFLLTNKVPGNLAKAAFGDLAELIVAVSLLADHEFSAVVAGIEPF